MRYLSEYQLEKRYERYLVTNFTELQLDEGAYPSLDEWYESCMNEAAEWMALE
jgi:hypothetical protein